MGYSPTVEQQTALDTFRTGGHLVIEAGAGTGKTSTLRMLAADNTRRDGIYFAYNKAIAREAAATFAPNMVCKTLHALAYRDMIRAKPFLIDRLKGPRQTAKDAARILKITGPARVNADIVLAPTQIANLALETVDRYARSGDEYVTRKHMPYRPRFEDPAVRDALAAVVGPHARNAWRDMNNPRGTLKISHDVYRKVWALTHPRLGADFLLVDEAQDSDGLTMALVRDQLRYGAQVVTVGDTNQAIYGWRGSQDAMGAFGGTRVYLTQSFRFGPAVADEANVWLSILDSRMRLTGTPTILSTVAPLGETLPDAILCRTNAAAVEHLIDLHEQGVPARIEGGADDVRRLAEAAQQLKDTGRTGHPDLVAFTTWGQVQDFVATDHAGHDLATAVKLIDTWGPDGIIGALTRQADPDRARVILSTAHKAKGLEWNRVRLADDFPAPKDGDVDSYDIQRDEAMLAYVAVTRAKNHLDSQALAWAHDAAARRKTAA